MPNALCEIVHIHECLRQEISDLAGLIRSPPRDASQRNHISSRLQLLLTVYTSHSNAEDRFIIPALGTLDAELKLELDKQHHKQAQLFERLCQLLSQPAWPEEASSLVDQLSASIYLHLRLEEEEMLPLLSKLATHELGIIVSKVIGDRSLDVMQSIMALVDQRLDVVSRQVVLDEFRAAARGSRFEAWVQSSPAREPPSLVSISAVPLDRHPVSHELGCSHYHRNCRLLAACCQRVYTCGQCHDEAETHAMRGVAGVWCMLCGALQRDAGKTCVHCNVDFGTYYCATCCIYESRETVYHCVYCGVCRRGQGLGRDFFHCFVCSADVSTTIRDHTCVPGSMSNQCPVCREELFSSRRPVHYVPCGHLLHLHCFEKALEVDYRCAVCRRAVIDMATAWARLDEVVARQAKRPVAPPLNMRCCDCRGLFVCGHVVVGDLVRSGAVALKVGEKCPRCGGFNTELAG